ncbi:MAG: DUF3786 domain-containing protein [Desulfobacterales bacterium]|nr:DUF3786 domain-containing protein [Desulfobacterales bacterium]
MPRIDDYINAKKISVETLSKELLNDISYRSGFKIIENKLIIPFLNRVYNVNYPDFNFFDTIEPSKDIPIQEQVLILHYLIGKNFKKTGRFIAYREIKGAAFYYSAFVKRAIDPLKKVFGRNISDFSASAELLKGSKINFGDVGFEFSIFPNVPIQIVLWAGDEEFPPEANILFDETIGELMSPEDIAWLSGMLSYRLISLTRKV